MSDLRTEIYMHLVLSAFAHPGRWKEGLTLAAAAVPERRGKRRPVMRRQQGNVKRQVSAMLRWLDGYG